jgi:hypothetical protein
MADFGRVVGSANSITITIDSLASATFIASSAVDFTSITPDPDDVGLKVAITPGTVSGNKQARIYLKVSLDGGSDYTTGPESGTTLTDEPNLKFIGVLPLNTNSTLQRGAWPVKATLGFIPTHAKLVILNDSGAAFSGSGNLAEWYAIKGVSV